MYAWAEDPHMAAAVAIWGLVLGVAGLLVTSIAFGTTIVQVMQAKSAAQAAATAANAVKSKVATYDVLVELSAAASAFREVQRHLKNSSWEYAISGYQDARTALVRAVEFQTALAQKDRGRLSAAIVDIAAFCNLLEQQIAEGKMAVDVAKALDACRRHSDLVNSLNVRVQGERL